MNLEEIKNANNLPNVVLFLIANDAKFKNTFKSFAPNIESSIESASLNPTCSCRNTIIDYIVANKASVGEIVFNYMNSNAVTEYIKTAFDTQPSNPVSISGKVAKTSISEWPEFAKKIKGSNVLFSHMSTSIVNDEVYVFFL